MDLSKIKKAYFIGIKGVLMTAVAQIFKERGIMVSGSDSEERFFTDKILKNLNIAVNENFSRKNIPLDVDLVIHSPAYSAENNIEVEEAIDRTLMLKNNPEVVAEIVKEKSKSVGVAGSHGKSTITSWIGFMMDKLGMDPTILAGTEIIQYGSNARSGASEYLVIEADEYKESFLNYSLKGAVLTSLDWDHPDYYPSEQDYQGAFIAFLKRLPSDGFIAAWGDDIKIRRAIAGALNINSDECLQYSKIEISGKPCVYFYGENSHNYFRLESPSISQEGVYYTLFADKIRFEKVKISLFGRHNALNSLAVISVLHCLGKSPDEVVKFLPEFRGTRRRMEKIKTKEGKIYFDDYAHHPAEVRATLQAFREAFPGKKIYCLFHPHTYSRTKALIDDFAASFKDADKALILEVYASAREKEKTVSSRQLVEKIKERGGEADYLRDIDSAAEYLLAKSDYDILISMGAGDVWKTIHKI